MRVIALAAVLFLLAVSVSWGSAGAVAGSATVKRPAPLSHVKTRWRTTVAKLPANAYADVLYGAVYISSISCVSPGNCTAVGWYVSKTYDREGLMLTEQAGHWTRGVEAVLPANADSSPVIVSLNSVSCASAGNCTAVGSYSNSSSGQSGLLLTETAGQWATGVEAVLPANGHPTDGVSLNSVSCASAGNCTAVGAYGDIVDSGFGLLLTEKAGHWANGIEAPLPSDAEAGHDELSSVSCSSGRSCSAVGTYNIAVGRDIAAGEGLLLTEKSGTWRAAKAVMPPDGPGEGVVLTSVSCASAGNCGAIGTYNINIDFGSCCSDEGVLLTQKAGKWRRGVTAEPPKNASPASARKFVEVAGISCPSPGNCGAVGGYVAPSGWHPTVLAEEAGKWEKGFVPALPRGAHDPAAAAVSCASPGNCTVVGSSGYASGPGSNGLLLTEIAGRWARGVTAIPPFFTAENLVSVSCPSPGNCGAVGGEGADSDAIDGLLLDSTTAPCVVPGLKGKTWRRARHSIESHNCFVGTVEYAPSGTIPNGHVISQALRPGSHRAPGTKVDLEVSSGP